MEYRDYYATLGVSRTATPAEIKKAFRKLARKHHPDVNASDAAAEARFKEVNEAYDVLGDPEKRKLYDQLGANWETYQRAGAGTPGADPFAGFRAGSPGGMRFEYRGDPADLDGFSDFFRTFFAGGMAPEPGQGRGGARTRSRGARTSAAPDIEEMLGGRGGSGYRIDFGGAEELFGAGNGRGRPGAAARPRRHAAADLDVGLEDVAAGTTALVAVGERRLEVTVPPGVESGQRIRLSGQAGTGPDAGDVTLTVRVKPHPVFTRSGSDLTRDLPITLREALLGADVRVPTLGGRTLLLTIPPGTQNGRVFRLRGQGLPRFKAEGRGDLLVRTKLVLPGPLDEEASRLAGAFLDHVDQPDPRSPQPGARSRARA
jgi:DnaJ-class molecular chaperone